MCAGHGEMDEDEDGRGWPPGGATSVGVGHLIEGKQAAGPAKAKQSKQASKQQQQQLRAQGGRAGGQGRTRGEHKTTRTCRAYLGTSSQDGQEPETRQEPNQAEDQAGHLLLPLAAHCPCPLRP